MSSAIIFLNGKFLPASEACLPVTDRGLQFGDGIFTTIRVEEGRPEYLRLHLDRLKRHAQTLGITLPNFSPDAIEHLIDHNNAMKGTWRLKIVVTGGDQPFLSLKSRDGHCFMVLQPYEAISHKNHRLCFFPYPLSRPTAKIKTLAYLDRLWVAQYALQNGYDDAVTLDCSGNILETSFSNLFWRIGDHLYIPDPNLPYLEGIMLYVVRRVAEKMGMEINFVQSTHIPEEAQVFLCNSLKHFCPVVQMAERSYALDPEWEAQLRSHLERDKYKIT